MAQKLQRRAMAPAWLIGITTPARAILHLIVVVTMLALSAAHARANVFEDIGGFVGDVGDWLSGTATVPGIASDAACNRYADEAVAAAVQNEQRACGFSGNRYTRNREGHFRWCKQQLTRGEHLLGEAAENETNIRNHELSRCSECNEYRTLADSAARENRIYHCGGTGDRWGSGKGHNNWCMGVRPSTAEAETKARFLGVSQCKAKYTPAQLAKCHDYATEAVKQARLNACGRPRVGRWSQDWDHHFAFCTWGWEHDIGGTDVVTAMKQESDARAKENRTCSSWMFRPSPSADGKINALAPATSNGITGVVTGRDSLAAASKAQRLQVARVDGREPMLAQPVVTGGTSGVSQVRPVLVPALPTGSIGAPPPVRTEGAIDALAWKHRLPTDLFKPKGSSVLPPATGGTGGAYPSKPIPTVPSTPPATGGTGGINTTKPIPTVPSAPPATGGAGGINTTKPIPSIPSTPPATGGTGGINTTKPIPPVPSKPPATDVFKQPALTAKASSGLPLVNRYGTKAGSPIASKLLRPDFSKPAASTGTLPVRSKGTVATVATKSTGRLQGGLRQPGASSGSVRRAPAAGVPSAGVAAARPSLLKGLRGR